MGKKVKDFIPPDDGVEEFVPPQDAVEFTPPSDAVEDGIDIYLKSFVEKRNNDLAKEGSEEIKKRLDLFKKEIGFRTDIDDTDPVQVHEYNKKVNQINSFQERISKEVFDSLQSRFEKEIDDEQSRVYNQNKKFDDQLSNFRNKRFPKQSPTVSDYVGAGAGAFNRGVGKVLSSPFKLIEAGGDVINKVITGQDSQHTPDETFLNNPAGTIGRGIENFFNDVNPYYENVNPTYQSVAEGLGQAAGVIGTLGVGGAGASASLAESTATAVPSLGKIAVDAAKSIGSRVVSPAGFVAGSMTAVPEWEAAKEAGLSDDEAFQTLVSNYFVGQTDIIPIQNMLGRLNRLTNNRLLNTVKTMGMGSFEEGLQESVQTYLSNQIASDTYDPDRDPLFQVLESAKVGAIVGGLVPGMMSVATSLPPDKKVKLERRIKEVAAQSAIEENTSTGDPQLDAVIDQAANVDTNLKKVIELPKIEKAKEEIASDIASKSDKTVVQNTPEGFIEAGEKSKKEQSPKALGEWIIKNSQTGDKIVIDEDTYWIVERKTDKKGNTEVELQQYFRNENDVFENNPSAIKLLNSKYLGTELENLSTRDASDLFENSYRNKNDEVLINRSRYVPSDIANKTEETVQNNEQTGAKPEALNEGKTINQINNENEKGQEKEVLTFDQTPEYQQADQKIRELAETVRQEPSAENARLLNEAIQERDNARIAFEQKKARQPKQEKSVQLTPAQATEAQIKILDRGIRLGRDITQKEVISQVRNAAKEANLSPQQIRVLANKAGKVSLSPESINNFNTFVDKVVNDAKFAEKVSKANKAVKVIKKQLPKATNKERAALKVFTALDPETDIDQYVSIADDVRRSLLPKRNKNYKPLQLTPVNQFIDQVTSDLYKKEFNREPNNLTPEQRYNEIQESQFNKRNQARVDKLAQDLGLTLEEQQLLLENKPFETSNKERVRSEFVNMAKVAKSKLNTVPSNADVEAIKQIDPDQLDIEDLKEYIEVVDRIYENNDFGNVATMVAEGKAQKAINDIGSRIKSKILNLLSFETSTASLPQAFQAIYGLAEDASYVQLKLGIKGIEDAHAAKVQAGFTFADSMNKMKEKFEKLYGKQKSGFTEDSIARQAIYRTLIKHDAAVDGDSYMRDKGKKAIETTIKTYRTKKQDEVADRLEKLYKPFVNAQSIADVEAIMKNIDPAGKRVFEFIVDTYSQYSDRVKRYNERNYNSFSQDIVNYAGETNVYKLDKSGNTIEPERVKRGSFKPKRLDSSKRFTGEVPEGSVIDLDFHVGVTRHIEELVFKLESEDSMLLVNQILKKKEKVLEILGSNQDPDKAEKIYEYIFDKQNGIYKSYLDSSFGVGMSRDPSESFVSNLLTIAHKAVYTATLSGPTQYIKQLTPLVSTAVNLGTDVDLLFDSRSQISKDKEGFNKWISTETVSTRGKEGSVIGLGDMLNSSKILQTENNLKKALFKDFASYIDNQFRNNLFVGLKGLLKGDSTAAETSFFAFYKEYLRNKGKIEFKSFEQEIALKDTDLRQEALAYAKQMVDNAQVVSNPAALSKVSKTRTVSGKLVKAQLLPFGSFTLSKGQRLQNDLKSLISGTSKQRARAAQDMTAVAAESIVFAGLKLGLKATWGAAWVAVLRELFNLDDPQDDEEKRKAKAAESSRYITEVITDNIPTVLLSSEPVRNAFIDGVEQVAYWWYKTENPDITKKEFEDETGISLRNRKNTGVADYLGSYGIIGDNLASFYKHVEDATNEELPVNKRALAAFTGLITFAGTVGLAPADIRFPIESENRKQLKQEKNANPTSEGGVPRRADKLPPLPKLPPRRTKLPQRPKLLPPKQ